MQTAARQTIAAHGRKQRVHGRFHRLGMQQVGNVPPLKVALGRDAVMPVERRAVRLAQDMQNLLWPQQVEPALLAIAVRILRAVEPPVGRRHFFHNIERSFLGDIPVDGLLRDLIGAAERDHHQRVVIQHFFKVRNEKAAVCGVAAKAVSDMVEQTAAIHLQQRGLRHVERLAVAVLLIALHQKQQVMGRGKLRRAAKAAIPAVVALAEEVRRPVKKARVRRSRGRRCALQCGRNAACRLQQGVPVVPPRLMDVQQQLSKPDGTVLRGLWKVGSGKERLLIGGHEDRGRPPAAAGERLTNGHIHAVNIGPLLPVHLDGDEMRIQNLRNFGVLKALVRHHVTPVAGAVADAQKHGLVLPPGLVKRLAAPWIPVDRVFRMLQQVGTCLLLEMVAHARFPPRVLPACGSPSVVRARERGAGDETTGRTCAILSIKHLPFSNQFKHIVPEKARMIPPVRNFMAERYAQMAQGEGSGRQPGKQTCVWNAFPRTS